MYDQGDTNPLTRRKPLLSVTEVPATENSNLGQPGTPVMWNTTTTARNDGFWDGPAPGYNFLYFIDAAALAASVPPVVMQGGHLYRVEYVFNTTWGAITLIHDVTVRPRNT